MRVVPLSEALDEREFGAKSTRLGAAIRAGLPVPPGIALDWRAVEHAVAGDELAPVAEIFSAVEPPFAVRSSAVGEDGANASFAGQHATVLNVRSEQGLVGAIGRVAASARAPEALAYRRRMRIETEPRMGIAVQHLVRAECAGVLFTKNPVTGKDERLIEAAWGLGEVVVAGLVTPDRYRVDRGGAMLEQTAGEKDIAIRPAQGEGVEEVASEDKDVYALCLDPPRLRRLLDLAAQCESYAEGPLDLEWAFEGEKLYLLQWRPITR